MSLFHIILSISFFITVSHQQVQIKCYDCVTPLGVEDATQYCNASLYCKGMYCTKGPDAMSNGIYHGCNDNPPLDKAGATCKQVENSMGTHSNCYCKNIDFCNGAATPTGWKRSDVIIVLMIFVYAYLFFIAK